jgi:L-threonylcarbamoyladenylate synthase
MDFLKSSKSALNRTLKEINDGGVVVFPTDTVYGFLADATNKKAVEKIYRIKKRPKAKPLPIFVKNINMAKSLAEIDKAQEKIIKKHWPGKFTFVLKRIDGMKLYGIDKNTIALRIPEYKPLNNLLKKINKPLAQTSVNISGRPSAAKVKEITEQFKNNKYQPDLIIDAGNLPKRKSSIIINLSEDKSKILRP